MQSLVKGGWHIGACSPVLSEEEGTLLFLELLCVIHLDESTRKQFSTDFKSRSAQVETWYDLVLHTPFHHMIPLEHFLATSHNTRFDPMDEMHLHAFSQPNESAMN